MFDFFARVAYTNSNRTSHASLQCVPREVDFFYYGEIIKDIEKLKRQSKNNLLCLFRYLLYNFVLTYTFNFFPVGKVTLQAMPTLCLGAVGFAFSALLLLLLPLSFSLLLPLSLPTSYPVSAYIRNFATYEAKP